MWKQLMYRGLLLMALPLLGNPASAAELIRCPDAASLMATAVQASVAPKPDFATLVAQRPAGSPVVASGAVPSVSTAPLDPLGILSGSTSNGSVARNSVAPTAVASSLPGRCAYVIQEGDSLSRIAGRALGNPSRWTELRAANPSMNPNALIPGRTIALPCAQSADASAPAIPAAAPAAAGVRALMAPSSASTAVPAVVQAPPPVVLPVWTARSGEYFSDIVKRWAKSAGYTVVFNTTADWRLAVAVKEQGSLEDVLDRLAKGLASNGRPPFIQIYSNKVIKIGGGA